MPPPSEPTSISDPAIGAGSESDCGFDESVEFDPLGDVIQLISPDRVVCVRLDRRHNGRGSLANAEYVLEAIAVGPFEEVESSDDPAEFCWYSSHHNFADWAHFATPSHRYSVRAHLDGWDGARTYELHTFEADPLDVSDCPAVANGETRIGSPLELLPYP